MQELKELTSGIKNEMLDLIRAHIQLLLTHHVRDGEDTGLVGLPLRSEGNSEMITAVSKRRFHLCDNSEACSNIRKEVMRLESLLFRYQTLMEAGQSLICTAGQVVALPKVTTVTELAK